MKVTIAIDSFKGSLSSLQAGYAAKKGILDVFPDAVVSVCALADGGEGTTLALTEGLDGKLEHITVTGPLGKKVDAFYGILPDGTAVIEMAAAAGITLINDNERNPLNTTTFGVGELILDAQNKPVSIFGNGLEKIAHIDDTKVYPELKDCTFKIACDVTNPLCGDNGCSAVYGPQKGATPKIISDMDLWLQRFADLVKQKYPNADKAFAGAGAAGGLGFAFMTFLDGRLLPGIEIVLQEIKLEKHIIESDIVVTGEGRLDSQTVMGKAPIGVARLAKKHSKPVIAFSGCATPDADICNEHGIDAFFPIVRSAATLVEALDIENAAKNMRATVKQVFNLIKKFN